MASSLAVKTWECVFKYVTQGREWKNVLHLTPVDGVAGDMPSFDVAIANIIASAWGNSVVSRLCTTTWFDGVALRDITRSDFPVVESDISSMSGTIGSAPVPLNVAFAVTLRTAHGGRSGRGRVYFTGFDETHCDARYMTGVHPGELVTNVRDFNAMISQEGVCLAVLSRVQGGVQLPIAETYIVNNIVLRDTRLDSQRRRLGR